MSDFNPFDMDFDDDVDGIDLLRFDHLMRYLLGRTEREDDEYLGPDAEHTEDGDGYDY